MMTPSSAPGADLRLSRRPLPNANVCGMMPLVSDDFRSRSTMPAPPNDADEALGEDELFAIWVSRLL